MKTLILTLSFSLLIISCAEKSKKKQTSEISFSLEKVWSTDTLLRTPESVLYEEKQNIIYVSNINSGSSEKDGNGFISKVSPQGDIIALKWVTGLNAPKGMGIHNDTLYVTDIDELVIIDIEKAQIVKKVPVEGAQFLNDISIDATGKVYISDSRNNIIYTYQKGRIKVWISEGIQRANGILCEAKRLLLAAADFLSIDYKTKEIALINDRLSRGDGITAAGDGYYFVSEWQGEVFLIKPDSTMISLLNTRKEKINSADIDYSGKDSLLLVPTFFNNTVDAYKWVVK